MHEADPDRGKHETFGWDAARFAGGLLLFGGGVALFESSPELGVTIGVLGYILLSGKYDQGR